MKKSFLYMLILAVILVLPTKATDVGKLRPVQTVAVQKTGVEYIVITDTKDIGRGESIREAIEDLQETTSATIYLDTAQYLIVSDESFVDTLRHYIKDSVHVYRFVGNPPMETVSKFLSAHRQNVTLGKWKEGDVLPLLDCTKERLKIFVK